MFAQLSFEEYKNLAENARRVTVYREISADRLTPIGIVERLSDEMLDGAILESGLAHQDAGRYSFIAFDSMAQFRVQNKIVTRRIGDSISTEKNEPFTLLRQLISTLSVAVKKNSAEFIAGAVGFLSYDAVRIFEDIPDQHASPDAPPDMLFNFYRNTLTYDHLKQRLRINVIIETEGDPRKRYEEAQDKIEALIKKVSVNFQPKLGSLKKHNTPVDVDISDEAFIHLVEDAKKYIVSGDAFQLVLSRCFKKRYSVTPFDIYRALRRVSPSPYMFYLPMEDSFIIGASPEKLISVRDGKVAINPIAGTRRRKEGLLDEAIALDLLKDEKEMAEHMMLVDLARNDLGAVCEAGTVKVTQLSKIKHFSHVSHICSVAEGQLQKNKDAFDALKYAFPAGTVSGAPKIRAMEIIDALETSKRGLYGGAICSFDYEGNFDSCIAIRMAELKEGMATVRTGAGIVFDSDPMSEANETRAKATSILEAITLAEEGF